MNHDDRALFARPAPGAAAPAFVLAVSRPQGGEPESASRATARQPRAMTEADAPPPFLDTGGPGEPAPSREATLPLAATRASRQRRALAVASVGLGLATIVAAAGAAVALQPRAPSLAVFDRAPSSAEVAMQQRMTEQQTPTFFGGEGLELRRVLTTPADDGEPAQDVWALRAEIDQPGVFTGAFICLTTAPDDPQGPGMLGCMDERDVARRGFIPLDQPRPTIVVDGEPRVIAWGPTGDARLIDPPVLPSPPASEPPSDARQSASASEGRWRSASR